MFTWIGFKTYNRVIIKLIIMTIIEKLAQKTNYAILLDNDYNGLKIPIDPIGMSFYGGCSGYYDGEKSDNGITVTLPIESLTPEEVEEFEKILMDNIKFQNKTGRFKLNTEHNKYETDKRPKLWIKLSYGIRGLADGQQFRIVNLT